MTFLFSDIAGSTRLVQTLGDGWPDQLEAHASIVRQAVAEDGGVEVSTDGDSFFCVFTEAAPALRTAVAIQRKMHEHPWPDGAAVTVRIGIHTGSGRLGGDNYVGIDLHQASRIVAAAHGGEILVSETTRALLAVSLPEGVVLRDLGEQRLSGLDEPVRLYRVVVDGLPGDFPPPRTLTAPMSLPEQLTSFVGRQEEMAEVVRLLGTTRLLTLTGPGGTGKTRLSIAAASESASRFPHGVFFVPLSTVADPDLVAPTILGRLGVSESTGMPEQHLTEYLKDRELLLVLDNFEQVVEAAPLVSRLLGAVPKLRVMVTSRAPLRVYGEQEFPVEPLALPDSSDADSPERLGDFESVALFVERARAVRPDFLLDESNSAAVAGIVAALDGLPLALELAAARMRLYSPQAIHDRLDDRLSLLSGGARDLPARQQTLRAAIGWSFDLLEPSDQILMRRLAVFVGGFEAGQVKAVVGPEADALDGFARLVDQSLIRVYDRDDTPRFRMLETIRRFSLEQLDQAGEIEEMRQRHAKVFLASAEEARPNLLGSEQAVWLDRLERDHDNLRAALEWVITKGETETADRLLWALWRFWQIRGHLYEGGRRAAAVLSLPAAKPVSRFRALEAAGGIAYWRGDLESSRLFYLEALELARSIGDPSLLGDALYNAAFGVALLETASREEWAKGDRYLDEAKTIFEQIGDRAGVAKTLWGQGTLMWARTWGRDLGRATEIYLQASELYRDLDDVFQYGWSQRMLGRALLELGRTDDAVAPLREALEVFASARDSSAITLIANDIAILALRRQEPSRALRLTGAGRALLASTGADIVSSRMNVWDELNQLADAEETEALLAEGGAMGFDELVAYITDTLDQAPPPLSGPIEPPA